MTLGDRHVGDDIRVTALRVAGIDCRSRVTISRGVCDGAIGVEHTRVEDRIDFRERATRRISVQGAIDVVTDNVG